MPGWRRKDFAAMTLDELQRRAYFCERVAAANRRMAYDNQRLRAEINFLHREMRDLSSRHDDLQAAYSIMSDVADRILGGSDFREQITDLEKQLRDLKNAPVFHFRDDAHRGACLHVLKREGLL